MLIETVMMIDRRMPMMPVINPALAAPAPTASPRAIFPRAIIARITATMPSGTARNHRHTKNDRTMDTIPQIRLPMAIPWLGCGAWYCIGPVGMGPPGMGPPGVGPVGGYWLIVSPSLDRALDRFDGVN